MKSYDGRYTSKPNIQRLLAVMTQEEREEMKKLFHTWYLFCKKRQHKTFAKLHFEGRSLFFVQTIRPSSNHPWFFLVDKMFDILSYTIHEFHYKLKQYLSRKIYL